MGRFENWRGVIGKPISGLLTFVRNPDFSDVRNPDFSEFVIGKSILGPLTLEMHVFGA